MKLLITLFCIGLAGTSFAQGLIFSSLTTKPDVLTMEKIYPYSGDSYLAHVQDEPLTHVKVLFVGDKLQGLQDHLMKTDSARIYCDGNSELAYDMHGTQYIMTTSINVCVDDEGWVVAHSLGVELTPEVLGQKAGMLANKIKKKKLAPGVFDGDTIKDLPGTSPFGQGIQVVRGARTN